MCFATPEPVDRRRCQILRAGYRHLGIHVKGGADGQILPAFRHDVFDGHRRAAGIGPEPVQALDPHADHMRPVLQHPVRGPAAVGAVGPLDGDAVNEDLEAFLILSLPADRRQRDRRGGHADRRCRSVDGDEGSRAGGAVDVVAVGRDDAPLVQAAYGYQ